MIDPDHFATIRCPASCADPARAEAALSRHATSRPTGAPYSTSLKSSSGFICASSSASMGFRLAGAITILPASADSVTSSSGSIPARSSTSRGTRTARLFPHFEIRVSIRPPMDIHCIYIGGNGNQTEGRLQQRTQQPREILGDLDQRPALLPGLEAQHLAVA